MADPAAWPERRHLPSFGRLGAIPCIDLFRGSLFVRRYRILVSTDQPTPQDYRWLVGPEAASWLGDESARDAKADVVALATWLRSRLSPVRAHLVLRQIELRRKAEAKLTQAEKLFLTPLGLEQATDQMVARYKAARFAPCSGMVLDLCCGVGGDLFGLAEVAHVVGIDRDPSTARLAWANCQQLGLDRRGQDSSPPGQDADAARASAGGMEVGSRNVGRAEVGRAEVARAEVACADVQWVDVRRAAAWHMDPDRRSAGLRHTQLEGLNPGPELIERLLEANPAAGIKLAPATEVPVHWEQAAELEWISHGGQCRQQLAWFGDLARDAGQRRATVLTRQGQVSAQVVGQSGSGDEVARGVLRYVYDPDPAVLAAELNGALAREHGLKILAPSHVYLTADVRRTTAPAGCFEVEEVMPLDMKRLKGLLKQRGIGVLEIKTRGVQHRPETLRKRLALSGSTSATLLVTRMGTRNVAILAHRVEASSDAGT
jgi:hypothetical protein